MPSAKLGREKENRKEAPNVMQPSSSFFFQQRHGKLDLKAIARVDVDELIRNVDVETLQVRCQYYHLFYVQAVCHGGQR